MTVACFVCIIAIPFLSKKLLKTEANYYSITINGNKVGAANTEEEVIVALASARQELSAQYEEIVYMDPDIEIAKENKAVAQRMSVDELSGAIYSYMFDNVMDVDFHMNYTVRLGDFVVTLESKDAVVSLFEKLIAKYDPNNAFTVSLDTVDAATGTYGISVNEKATETTAAAIVSSAISGTAISQDGETVVIGDALHVVSYLDNMPNPDLKWEKTGQWDLGFELGLFNNRLNFDISYYYKYTSDLLLDHPVPESTGYSSIMDNIGAVSNRGLDILVTAYPIQTHDFQWTSTLNLGFNKNRVEKLDESASVDPVTGKRQITTDGFVGYDMLIREGEELSSFYGYKRAGIYDGIPSNWDPETMNIPSTIGEKVTYKKREIIGNGLPDWMGSFINTFNYKGFDLTLDFQFTWGVDVMQEYYHSTVARFLTNGIDRLYKEAWHPTLNPSGKEQAIRLNNFGQGANNQADDDWVCNGSYLRCNMIQLGYTFNPTLIKKIGLSSLRLYANVNNAFLITSKDYNGYDPDNSSRLGDNKWGANRQFFTYPRPRTFTFGLNVAF